MQLSICLLTGKYNMQQGQSYYYYIIYEPVFLSNRLQSCNVFDYM
jgi:hypothetical protein